MSRLSRVFQKILGSAASNIGEFGSGADGTKVLSTDLATLMSNAAWAQGWSAATIGNSKFPPLEEMNALDYIMTTQLAYLFQQGIPEWDASTVYYINSIVMAPGGLAMYASLTNANTGNALSSTGNWKQIIDFSVAPAASGSCKLVYSSGTQVNLNPFNGNFVTFPSGTRQSIGTGISAINTNCFVNGVPNSTLANSTLYYVYLVAGGTAVLDFSTTGYATDATTGIVIKNGDPTHVLVGMVSTSAGGQFVQTAAARQVRSWFNENGVNSSANFTTGRSTASSTSVEVNSEIRNSILTWAGERVTAVVSGSASNSAGGAGVGAGVGIDSTTVISGAPAGEVSTTGGNGGNIGTQFSTNSLSEGLHYFTLLAYASAGGLAQFTALNFVQCVTSK